MIIYQRQHSHTNTLNIYFKTAVSSLEISGIRFITTGKTSLADQVEKLFKKYECYP